MTPSDSVSPAVPAGAVQGSTHLGHLPPRSPLRTLEKIPIEFRIASGGLANALIEFQRARERLVRKLFEFCGRLLKLAKTLIEFPLAPKLASDGYSARRNRPLSSLMATSGLPLQSSARSDRDRPE